MKYFYLITVMAFIHWSINYTQDFSGKYLMQTETGELSLTLNNDKGSGNFSGRLTGNGNTFLLQGNIRNGILHGNVGNKTDGLIFEASLNNNTITLVIMETDGFNQPVLGTAQTLIFQRQLMQDNTAKNNSEVIINGNVLSNEQINGLIKMYGIKPLPGSYWYDAKSGLYGAKGYQAFGFMYPGHNFGSLSRNASNGNTGIVVNGRELPQTEWAIWSYILGYWIQPGYYWFDSNGNAGYEGNPLPLVNMFSAARQNAYQGKGGSGDNFWSTRFSAGNYDSDNQRGYVSVPGYGPVGYGF